MTENKVRKYVFTINNPDIEWTGDELPDDPAGLFAQAGTQAKYIIYSYEIGMEGNPHLQGLLHLKSPQRPAAIIKWGGEWSRAHLEPQRGTDKQADDYASKEEDETHVAGPWRFGELDSQGQRHDLKGLVETAKTTRSLKRTAEEHPELFIKYHRGVEKFLEVTNTEKRAWKTEVKVLYGDPGTGKTKMAFESDPDAYFLRKGNAGAVWWDGYTGQQTIIIDDFYGWIPYDLLLRICDRYPLRVDIKGGSVEFLGRTLWITSNQPWEQWYTYSDKLNKDALERRIDEILYFGKGRDVEKEK